MPPPELTAAAADWMTRLKQLPEAMKLLVSAVALVAMIAAFVGAAWLLFKVYDALQSLYWRSGRTFRRWYRWVMFAGMGVSFAWLIGAALWIGGVKLTHAVGWVSDARQESLVERAKQSSKAMQWPLYVAVGMLFFVSQCKSNRARVLQQRVEKGEIAQALLELEDLRREPGQNVTVDVTVDCLYAYVLVLVGQEQKAVECLAEAESRMRGSTRFQQGVMYIGAHRQRLNAESVELQRMRIAGILCELGRFDEALRLTNERVSQTKTEVVRQNIRGTSLAGLGDHAAAEAAFRAALHESRSYYYDEGVIQETLNVRKHLGQCLLLRGAAAEAERTLREAARELAARLAPGHPDLVDCQCLLAQAYAAQSRDRPAAEGFEQAMAGEAKFLARAATGMRESDLLRLVRRMQWHLEQYLDHVRRRHRDDPRRLEAALEQVLRRKGLTLDATAWLKKQTGGHVGARLQEVRRKLAEALFSQARDLDALEAERIALEKESAGAGGAAGRDLDIDRVTVRAVRDELPAGAALVEFISVRPQDAAAGLPQRRARAARYLAFVLAPGRETRLFDLGEADAINRLVERLHAEMERQAAGSGLSSREELSRELFRRCVAPWEESVAGLNQWVIAPDDALNFVSFVMLQDERRRFLVERVQVRTVGSGRDLLRRAAGKAGAGGRAALFGDPDFEGPPGPPPDGNSRGLGTNPLLKQAASDGPTLFGALPGTAEEVRALRQLLADHGYTAVETRVRREATSRAVADVKRPAILHLATHAFFLPSYFNEVDESAFLPSLEAQLGAMPDQWRRLRGVAASPYLRSGLALAGANRAGSGGSARGNGLLTAEEVLSMDLEGTDLVVLSACQTALGVNQRGEGVQGLHRAFLVAGARNVVASLWKVSDEWTVRLMRSCYAHYLRGEDKAAALRLAMLETIEALRREGSDANPALWAAFVLLGA